MHNYYDLFSFGLYFLTKSAYFAAFWISFASSGFLTSTNTKHKLTNICTQLSGTTGGHGRLTISQYNRMVFM